MNRNLLLQGTVLNPLDTFNRGKLVITFDEANANQYTDAFPLFVSKNAKATFYVTSDFPGANGCMTWPQIKEMSDAGMCIGGHGKTHAYFDAMTKVQVEAELNAANATFVANGLPAPTHMAYPGGHYTFDVKDWIAPFMKTSRGVDGTFYPLFRNSDKLALNATSIDNLDSAGYYRGGTNGSNVIKGYIDQVAAQNGALILYAHGVTIGGGTTSVATAKLAALIDYAQGNNVDVIAISQLYAEMKKGVQTYETKNFTLSPTGNGAGISTLSIGVNEDTTLTLTGGAKFYTDAAATQGESETWNVSQFGNIARTIYIKCPSMSTLTVQKDKIRQIQVWASAANAALLSGNIAALDKLNYLQVEGNNSISGDISGLVLLTRLVLGGSNTISGSIANLINLTYLYLAGNNTISGSISNLTNLAYIHISGGNTISGSVAGLIKLTSLTANGNCTIGGSVSALTSLQYLSAGAAGNTLGGDITTLTALTWIENTGTGNTLSGSISGLVNLGFINVAGTGLSFENVTNIKGLCYLKVSGLKTLTSANVNQILADFWLNRNEPKITTTLRSIIITGSPSTGAPTGQGVTDKANLQAYRSPAPPGTAALWTVITR